MYAELYKAKLKRMRAMYHNTRSHVYIYAHNAYMYAELYKAELKRIRAMHEKMEEGDLAQRLERFGHAVSPCSCVCVCVCVCVLCAYVIYVYMIWPRGLRDSAMH